MGYRSDVTIVMYPKDDKDFALLKLYVDETFPDTFEVCENNNCTKGFKYLVLEVDSVKWYQGYEEVDVYTRAFSMWEGMFERSDETGRPESIFHYEFLRIGEDCDDIVYDASEYCRHILNVERRAAICI